jgi:acyl-CoA thioesterase-1
MTTDRRQAPALPRVLLVGDSISMGYEEPVRSQLAGRASVQRIVGNGRHTRDGLERIDDWLGDGDYDLIHFNFGLHDLLLVDGCNQVPIDEYAVNLDALVDRFQRAAALLVFATTTPVPPGANRRRTEDAVRYNAAALDVISPRDIAVDDLYTFAKPRLAAIQQPHNVHFTQEGADVLGGAVAASIEQALHGQVDRPHPTSTAVTD